MAGKKLTLHLRRKPRQEQILPKGYRAILLDHQSTLLESWLLLGIGDIYWFGSQHHFFTTRMGPSRGTLWHV